MIMGQLSLVFIVYELFIHYYLKQVLTLEAELKQARLAKDVNNDKEQFTLMAYKAFNKQGCLFVAFTNLVGLMYVVWSVGLILTNYWWAGIQLLMLTMFTHHMRERFKDKQELVIRLDGVLTMFILVPLLILSWK